MIYLLSLENKYNNSIYTQFIKYLFNFNINILPFNYKLTKKIILFFILISFLVYLIKILVFNLLKQIILSLDIYN